MNALLKNKFSFGKIVVDPKSNAIYINGVEKRLEPKLINLLCLFAAQGRDVISRQDITQTIWSDVVVGEESITRAIFALRNALGDDAKQPQYIETIPKKGYRFLADVQLITEPAPGNSEVVSSTISIKRSWLIYSCGLILVIALAIFLGREEKLNIQIASILPLTKMEGIEVELNLNAKKDKLLFVHDSGKANDIYSRDLKDGKDVLWAHDEFLKTSPIWIDDNSIAYTRWYNRQFQIIRHYKDQPPQIIYPSTKMIYSLSLLENNSENLFFLEVQNNDLVELKSLNLRNGKQQNWRDSIPELPRKISHLQPSKKANTLLMVMNEFESPAIISLDLQTKKVTVLNRQFTKINKVVAVNAHDLLVVGASGGGQGIWFVDEKKPPQLILRSSGSEEIVDIQIDTKRNIIFYSNSQANRDLQSISFGDQNVQDFPELNSNGIEMQGQYSNDKKQIYFLSNRTGYFELWRYEIESKSVKQITSLNTSYVFGFALSHTDKSIAISYKTDDLYLGIIDSTSGYLFRNVKTPVHRFPLAWSFDDKTLYVSEHEAEVNLFTYDVSTLKPALFAPKSGLYVKDLDGKKLIYVNYDRHGLVERDLLTQKEKILHDNIANLFRMNPGHIKFIPNKNELYAMCDTEEHSRVCSYSLSASNSPAVVLRDIPTKLWPTDFADDGEALLVNKYIPSSGDLMKMQLKP